MKLSFTIRILLLMIPTTLISSGLYFGEKPKSQESKTLQNAKKTFLISKQEVNSDPKTYISNFQKFVKEADSKIDTNKKKFAELKVRFNEICPEKKECTNILAELELDNSNLKSELDTYVLEGNGNWEEFRAELYQDLYKLDLAYNDAKQ